MDTQKRPRHVIDGEVNEDGTYTIKIRDDHDNTACETDIDNIPDITEDACVALFKGHWWNNAVNGNGGINVNDMYRQSRTCQLCNRHEVMNTEWEEV